MSVSSNAAPEADVVGQTMGMSCETFRDEDQPPAEPGTAQWVFNEGQRDLRDGRFDEALRKFNFLLEHDRNHPAIIFNVGTVYLKQKMHASAYHMFRRALEFKADFPEAWNNIGWIYEHDNEKEKAEECFRKAIECAPKRSEFWNNLSTIFVNNGTPGLAIEHANKSIELNENNVDAKWNKALALLELGQYEEGFELYEYGKVGDLAKRKKRNYWPAEKGKTPEWEGPKAGTKTLAVYGEQGVGDELMFSSILPEVQRDVETVIFDCHPRLHAIYRHSFPGLHVYGTRKEDHIQWPNEYEIDACCAVGSLARFYRKSETDFPRVPYLKPFENRVEAWQNEWAKRGVTGKPRIGISWRGGTKITRKDLRSIMLDKWRPIFDSVDAHWISLQYEHKEIHGLAKTQLGIFRQDCSDWGPEIIEIPEADDLDECYGAVIHTLDLVISINTSLVHACGAFGVPCWVLTPSKPAWRYSVKGERMIWYGDHVYQFRQAPESQDWEPVLARVRNALQDKFPAHSKASGKMRLAAGQGG